MNVISIRIFVSLSLIGVILMFVADVCVPGFFCQQELFIDKLSGAFVPLLKYQYFDIIIMR